MEAQQAGSDYFTALIRHLRDDRFVEEVNIIPSPVKCGDEPVIVEDHKLGIKLWCVKELYDFAYLRFMRMKTCDATDDVLDLTRAILLINAECYIAWNVRKECVLCGKLKVEEDLRFCGLILSQHPRSVETFIHRRWLLMHYNKHQRNNDDLEAVLKRELLLCTLTASKHEANYIAWSHREWVVDTFLVKNLKILMSDWKRTEQWVRMHISDHSGFQYRQFLLKSLQPLCNVAHLLAAELRLTSDLIQRFPCHEAVWNHRRYLVYYYLQWTKPVSVALTEVFTNDYPARGEPVGACEQREGDSNKPTVKKRKLHEESATCLWSLEEELCFCENTSGVSSQSKFSDSHRKWINYMLKQILPSNKAKGV